MRLEYCALVLWVELGSDVPFQLWYLNDLNEVRLWVTTNTLHTVLLVFLYILVVELVAVTVTLLDFLCVVDSLCAAALTEYALVGSETHCATHV